MVLVLFFSVALLCFTAVPGLLFRWGEDRFVEGGGLKIVIDFAGFQIMVGIAMYGVE